eukprot:11715148-Alexandrium_andersonii.AAC.1
MCPPTTSCPRLKGREGSGAETWAATTRKSMSCRKTDRGRMNAKNKSLGRACVWQYAQGCAMLHALRRAPPSDNIFATAEYDS